MENIADLHGHKTCHFTTEQERMRRATSVAKYDLTVLGKFSNPYLAKGQEVECFAYDLVVNFYSQLAEIEAIQHKKH